MPSQRTDTLKAPVAPGATVSYTGTAGLVTQKVIGDTVMVWGTTDFWFTMGKSATATDTPIPAFTVMFFPMPTNAPGQSGWAPGEPGAIFSAIQISAGGSLFVQQFA